MSKKGKKIYVRKDLVGVDELSELDFELYDAFNYDYDTDEIDIINSIRNGSVRQKARYYVDTTPLKITELEKLLKKYKKKGATHIAMEHHPDHNGYEFSAFNIELADDELIKTYEDERKIKLILNNEWKIACTKVNEIEKKLRDLKV